MNTETSVRNRDSNQGHDSPIRFSRIFTVEAVDPVRVEGVTSTTADAHADERCHHDCTCDGDCDAPP
jgi:hypothetical protein